MSHYRIPRQLEMRPAQDDNSLPGLSDFSNIISLTYRESKILAGVIQCDNKQFNLVADKASAITEQIRAAKNKLKEQQKWQVYHRRDT